MLAFYNRPLEEVPVVVLDVETTGIMPGVDAAVQVALVRFEKREIVGRFRSFVSPGRAIPKEATAVHGIAAKHVKDAWPIDDVFDLKEVRALLEGAQPAAYNARFDQRFVPARAFADWTWPRLDPFVAVRVVDKYAKGAGRHKLEAACKRRRIPLVGVHDALADAEATGRLLYHVFEQVPALLDAHLGGILEWQLGAQAAQWGDYNSWLSKQPEKKP
jgi:DNA polymerase III alpha subunit (gram-positive type)